MSSFCLPYRHTSILMAVWLLAVAAANLEHRQERLLRDLHAAHALHPLLAFLLLLEELAFARDVAAVALRQNILAHRLDGLARDHLVSDCRLQRHFEHLAWNQLPKA